MKFGICLLVIGAFTSCTPVDSDQDATNPRTPGVPAQISGMSLLIDSAFIADTTRVKVLSYKDVRRMAGRITDLSEYKSLERLIDDFCTIDSVKRAGTYVQWLDSLDIGMTRDASADEIGTIHMGDGTPVDLWRLRFSCYETCPVFNGTYVIARLEHGRQITHLPVGKNFVWIDPPASINEVMTSHVSNDWISITNVTKSDDEMDTPGEEVQTNCYTVRVTGSGPLTSEMDPGDAGK